MRHPLASRLLTGLLAPVLGLVLAVPLLLAPTGAPAGAPTSDAELSPVASSRCFGARAFASSACNPLQRTGTLTPTTTRASNDRPGVYDRDCIAEKPEFDVVSCELALRKGRLHVALLGNSLASQWADALGQIGRDHGWRVTTYLASACPPSALAVKYSYAPRCTAWGKAVRERMIRQGVDVVLVSSGSGGYRDKAEAEEGYLDYLRPLTTAGVLVETLRATPHATATLRQVPAQCLRANPTNYLNCSGARSDWVTPDPMYDAGARLRRDRSGLIDLTDRTCTARTCVSAAGGVLLFRDGLHLTRTYVETLRPYLDQRLLRAIRADR